MPSLSIGLMREKLLVQLNSPPSLIVSSLTRSSTTATVTTTVPHGYLATDYVKIAGCNGSTTGYNSGVSGVKIVAAPTSTTFTFTCSGSLATPATGTITVVYFKNAGGGQGENGAAWRTLDSLAAEMIPLGSMERLQIQAVQSTVQYRFRVHRRSDIEPTMRVLWTPSWVSGEARKTLVLIGPPLPVGDGRRFMYLECSEVAA